MTPDQFRDLCRCKQSPWYFLTTHVQTHDPARGVFTYPRFDYLKELVEIASRERFLLVPKSRQLMVTWTMVGYFLWQALFRVPGLYLFLSRNERCAEELLERTRFILDHLPLYMRPKITGNSKEEIAFGKLGSRIISLPSTPHGPRMYSPNGVFWDEMAFTPFDEMIWAALKPALDSGGKFVGVSSSGGAHNLFARFVLTEGTRSKEQGTHHADDSPPLTGGQGKGSATIDPSSLLLDPLFNIHRIHYTQHPERNNAKWKQQAAAGLSAARWNQEQEISFESLDDLVYSEFDPVRHILPAPWNVNSTPAIYRTIDFGFRHPYVLWLQIAGDDDFVIFDEWAGEDRTTEEMLHAVRAIDLSHGFTERDVLWTACDPAGAAAQDSGISPADLLQRNGIKLRYRSSRIEPGIQLVKAALRDATGRTRLRISPKCTKLISDLRNYKWSPTADEPLKDGLSDHSMDALRYFFVNLESHDDLPIQARAAGWR